MNLEKNTSSNVGSRTSDHKCGIVLNMRNGGRNFPSQAKNDLSFLARTLLYITT